MSHGQYSEAGMCEVLKIEFSGGMVAMHQRGERDLVLRDVTLRTSYYTSFAGLARTMFKQVLMTVDFSTLNCASCTMLAALRNGVQLVCVQRSENSQSRRVGTS